MILRQAWVSMQQDKREETYLCVLEKPMLLNDLKSGAHIVCFKRRQQGHEIALSHIFDVSHCDLIGGPCVVGWVELKRVAFRSWKDGKLRTGVRRVCE